MSTFITVGSRSSDDMTMRECVDGINLKYALRWHIYIHLYQFISCYASAVHKHTFFAAGHGMRERVGVSGSSAYGCVGQYLGNIHFYPHRFAIFKWYENVCVCVCKLEECGMN